MLPTIIAYCRQRGLMKASAEVTIASPQYLKTNQINIINSLENSYLPWIHKNIFLPLGMFLLRSVASECTSSSTQIMYNDNLYYNPPSQKVQDLLKTCRSKLQTICLRIVRSVLILAFYHA